MQHCRDGNPDGFRFLVERYQGHLFAYLFTQLGDCARAEDAAQEAFVRAFFSLKKLKKPRFVPYEIELRNGEVRKHNLALKQNPENRRWYVDGGI